MVSTTQKTALVNALERRDNAGHTALQIAAQKGHWPNFEILMNAGARVHVMDERHNSPVHYAAKNAPLMVLRTLLNKNFDHNKPDKPWAMYPIHYAVESRSPVVISLLVQHGARVNIKNFAGWSSMHLAVKNNFPEMIKALFNEGGDINALDDGRWTPLHIAAHYNSIQSAEMLIELGANTRTQNCGRLTAHDIAQQKGHKQVMALIESAENTRKTIIK